VHSALLGLGLLYFVENYARLANNDGYFICHRNDTTYQINRHSKPKTIRLYRYEYIAIVIAMYHHIRSTLVYLLFKYSSVYCLQTLYNAMAASAVRIISSLNSRRIICSYRLPLTSQLRYLRGRLTPVSASNCRLVPLGQRRVLSLFSSLPGRSTNCYSFVRCNSSSSASVDAQNAIVGLFILPNCIGFWDVCSLQEQSCRCDACSRALPTNDPDPDPLQYTIILGKGCVSCRHAYTLSVQATSGPRRPLNPLPSASVHPYTSLSTP